MKTVSRLTLCLLPAVMLCLQTGLIAQSQEKITADPNTDGILNIGNLPQVTDEDITSLVFPTFQRHHLLPPMILNNRTKEALYSAILENLGVRYRLSGTGENGFDCSGFVWRVYQDAGAEFDRVAARTLWRQLPEATGADKLKFGTLVFFNGLRHVGIVRDAFSFYHASRTHGVTLSFFAGYWGKRITGYRKVNSSE